MSRCKYTKAALEVMSAIYHSPENQAALKAMKEQAEADKAAKIEQGLVYRSRSNKWVKEAK